MDDQSEKDAAMKYAPSEYTLTSLATAINAGAEVRIGAHRYPARPIGLFSLTNRIRLAWEVFTGRADVLRWPGGQ